MDMVKYYLVISRFWNLLKVGLLESQADARALKMEQGHPVTLYFSNVINNR